MALSNVERQRRYRERQPRVHDRRDRRTRHQQWHDAIATIITLRNAWQAWRDAIPEALEASPTAERLDEILRSATGLGTMCLAKAPSRTRSSTASSITATTLP